MGTFQKYYTQSELKEYLQTQLDREAIPAALGVFYVFKDGRVQQEFLAQRYRRTSAAPRTTVSEKRFEENRGLLDPFMARIAELGRLPGPDEYEDYDGICERFGSVKRAFALIKRVTRIENWSDIRRQRTEDLLVYLALARFRKRPPLSRLPVSLQRDIKEFLGPYKRACERADQLLFSAGDADAIDEACRRSEIGKLLPNALYVHRSAVDTLEPLLRVYEGCARAYLGEIEDATIVKLHRFSGKVSYLAYPDFDRTPHPPLVRSVKLSRRSLELDVYDYSTRSNPPILHRKEAFVLESYPHYQKFAKLTQQEERHGLLDDTATIGTQNGWEHRLEEAGFSLKGHRIVRRTPIK
jgi:DNA phosphorothioation-associated putative methyltransferase